MTVHPSMEGLRQAVYDVTQDEYDPRTMRSDITGDVVASIQGYFVQHGVGWVASGLIRAESRLVLVPVVDQ